MKSLVRTLIASIVFVTGISACISAHPVRIVILHTTDMHGHVRQTKNYDGRVIGGLDRIATLIKRERKDSPNVILLDNGDTIQGNSQAFLFKGRHIIDCMNYLGYDAMTVGNHEFNFGMAVLAERKWDSSFPWLSANIYRKTPGASAYTPTLPHIIKTVGGVRVGIIGLTVTDIPEWEQPEFIERLEFRDVVETARLEAAKLRPKCDVLVVLAHTGVEPGSADGETTAAGAGRAIAEACPELDVIICGHKHRVIESVVAGGVLLSEAGYHASHLGRIEIEVEPSFAGSPAKVISKKATLLEATPDVPIDDGINDIMRPYESRWRDWNSKVLGKISRPLDFRGSQKRETAAVDFIHRAMQWATKTDVSFHWVFNDKSVIPAGYVTNEHVFQMYGYDNALWVLELTGRQIKDALEEGLAAFGTYRFITAGGLHYTFDVSRPKGERLLEITYRGKPLGDKQVLSVAVNHYNAVRNGKSSLYRNAVSVKKTGLWVRDALADYLAAEKMRNPKSEGWWKVVGDIEQSGNKGPIVPHTGKGK